MEVAVGPGQPAGDWDSGSSNVGMLGFPPEGGDRRLREEQGGRFQTKEAASAQARGRQRFR